MNTVVHVHVVAGALYTCIHSPFTVCKFLKFWAHTHTHTHTTHITHTHTHTHMDTHTHPHTHTTHIPHTHTRTWTHTPPPHTHPTHTHTHTHTQEYQQKAQEDKERYIQEYVAYQETDIYKEFIRKKFPNLQSKKPKTDDEKSATSSKTTTTPSAKVRHVIMIKILELQDTIIIIIKHFRGA